MNEWVSDVMVYEGVKEGECERGYKEGIEEYG